MVVDAQGMMVAIRTEHWAMLNRLSDADMESALREMVEQVQLRRYRQSPRGPKKKPPLQSRYQNGTPWRRPESRPTGKRTADTIGHRFHVQFCGAAPH
jgi:hypothetical protein